MSEASSDSEIYDNLEENIINNEKQIEPGNFETVNENPADDDDDDILPVEDDNENVDPNTPTTEKRFRAPVDRLTQLPLSRIKAMIKNFDPEWKGQSSDAAVLMCLAGEEFCKYLAKQSFEVANTARRKTIKKEDVNFVISTDEPLAFLEGCFDSKTGCL